MGRSRETQRRVSWGDLVLVDLAPEEAAARAVVDEPEPDVPPLHCRLRLWHTWREHHVHGGGSYVMCAGCGRYMPEPLFGRPWE